MSSVLDTCVSAAERLRQMVIDAADGCDVDQSELAQTLVLAGASALEFHAKVELLQQRREAADRLASAARFDGPLSEAKAELRDANAMIDETIREHQARLVALRRKAEDAALEVERIRREQTAETREAQRFLVETCDPEIDKRKASDEAAYSDAMTRYNAAVELRHRLEKLKRLEQAAANRTSLSARDEATELKRELALPKWKVEADAMAAAEREMAAATMRARGRAAEKLDPEAMPFFD